MNRYFISDKESDTLIALATKLYGLKIGELINIALKNEFLPVTEPFRTEAAFILQCNANGTLDAWEIKQSMSRGIRALGTRPVYDSERLQGIFARYHLHEKHDNCSIANDEALWESAIEVYEALGKPVPSDCSKLDGARLVDDIFADWESFGLKRLYTMCWQRSHIVVSRMFRLIGLRASLSSLALSAMHWVSGAVFQNVKTKT